MKKEDIYWNDWERILLGKAPWEFMVEILIRTLIIYLILLLMMRLIGRRLNAQLSITEIAILLSLGAIIAVPLQTPDRGLLPALVIFVFATVLQRGLNILGFRYTKADIFIKGKMALIIKDGKLELDQMKKELLTQERLFSVLRVKNIKHLGEIKRVYMETSGGFSVFKNKEPIPGLSILPNDPELLKDQPGVNGYYACTKCGQVEHSKIEPQTSCKNCNCMIWTNTYL